MGRTWVKQLVKCVLAAILMVSLSGCALFMKDSPGQNLNGGGNGNGGGSGGGNNGGGGNGGGGGGSNGGGGLGPQDLTKINHIVFMAQENRSFDHYCGHLNEDRK